MPGDATDDVVLVRAVQACLAWERHEPASFRSELAPGRLSTAAHAHRVAPLLATWRERLGLEPADADALAATASRNTQRALLRAQALRSSIAALERAGIDTIVLKGLPLALRTTGDLGGRHCGDLDLFVRRAQLERAAAVIEGLGGRPRQGLPPADRKLQRRWVLRLGNHVSHDLAAAHVEVHWELTKYGLLPLSFDDAWARRVTTAIGDSDVSTLGPAHELLFVAIHGAKHHFARLQWLVDLARLLTITPEAVRTEALELAHGAGLQVAYTASVRLATRLAPGRTDEPDLSTGQRRRIDRLARGMWASCLRGQEPRGLARTIADLRFRRGASYRLGVLAGTVVPAEMMMAGAGRPGQSPVALAFRSLRRRP